MHQLTFRALLRHLVQYPKRRWLRRCRQKRRLTVEPGDCRFTIANWRLAEMPHVFFLGLVVEHNRVRAPFYPLPKIQRLGYLDEHDDILCCKPLNGGRCGTGGKSGADYVPGRRYQIRSTTVAAKRAGTKMNNIGLLDEVEWNGQHLVISEEANSRLIPKRAFSGSKTATGIRDMLLPRIQMAVHVTGRMRCYGRELPACVPSPSIQLRMTRRCSRSASKAARSVGRHGRLHGLGHGFCQRRRAGNISKMEFLSRLVVVL